MGDETSAGGQPTPKIPQKSEDTGFGQFYPRICRGRPLLNFSLEGTRPILPLAFDSHAYVQQLVGVWSVVYHERFKNKLAWIKVVQISLYFYIFYIIYFYVLYLLGGTKGDPVFLKCPFDTGGVSYNCPTNFHV